MQKQKWRDLLKSAIIKKTEGIIYVLLGAENQSDIHYAMPVKNMIYDAMNYGSQVAEAARSHKDKKDFDSSAEFLAGFKRDDKLTPVITLTVYWGAEAWDAPRCLHDMCKAWQDQWLDGKAEGREEGIEALILDNLEDGKTEEVIINKLIRRFGLKPEEAQNYYDKYAKESSEIQLIP